MSIFFEVFRIIQPLDDTYSYNLNARRNSTGGQKENSNTLRHPPHNKEKGEQRHDKNPDTLKVMF